MSVDPDNYRDVLLIVEYFRSGAFSGKKTRAFVEHSIINMSTIDVQYTLVGKLLTTLYLIPYTIKP